MEQVTAKPLQHNKITTPESFKSSSTPSSNTSNFTFEADSIPYDNLFHFQKQLLTDKYQELLLYYDSAFVSLKQAFDEVNHLRDENLKLRSLSIDLSVLITAKENDIIASFQADEKEQIPVKKVEAETKTEKATRGGFAVGSKPVLLNKASVVVGCSKGSDPPRRIREIAKPPKDDEQVEVGVYKQGMSKTELCKKWEETSDCPYGERCQFAHGVEELRPVLRHPRYKTQLCRMISSGGTCPYGHRCHFRHRLDPSEEEEVLL